MFNLLVPVNAEQSASNQSESSKWQTGSISYTNNLNRVACFQNKLYIAVGAGGMITTSQDGLKWTANLNISNVTSSELYDIVCTKDQIIVVGEKGTILRSTDGFEWSTVKPIINSSIRKVIYGKNIFLAFTDKTGEILTSIDGSNWKAGKTSAKQYISDAVWNGKVFVTVGGNGEISTSKDGAVWQTKILKNKPSFSKILWNGKMFVTFGTTYSSTDNYNYTSGQYIASSKDGYSWSIKTLKTKALKKDSPEIYSCSCRYIIWNGKSFSIILGEQTGQPPAPENMLITYTSKNGIDWKRTGTNIGGDSFVMAWTGNEFLTVCNYFAMPGYYYCYTIYYSKDGVNWEEILKEDKMDRKANDIIYANGKFIFVGDGGEIRSSADGINWNQDDIIHYPQLWDGKRFISVDSQKHYIYTSVDGLTWKKENQIDWNITYGHIFWSGNEYITFGPNYYISTSKDLITWDKAKYDYTGSLYNNIGSISAFTTDGKKYILAGNNGTAVSGNLKNWESRKATNYYKSVIIGGYGFVALNIYGQIDVSADGLKWKRIKIKDYNNTIREIVYADDKFIGVGTNGEIWYSKDGANWTKAESTVNKALTDICWTGNKFIAAGKEGTIISSDDGVEWQQEESPLKINFENICTNGEIVLINSLEGSVYKILK
jgi:photosystem II stability/assembly factor-like uncharacterized protein